MADSKKMKKYDSLKPPSGNEEHPKQLINKMDIVFAWINLSVNGIWVISAFLLLFSSSHIVMP